MEGILMETHEKSGARNEFLSFRLGREEYAIDILQVREIREHQAPTHIAGAPDYVKGVINLRGAIVPIVDLRARFGLEALVAGATPVVIILSIADRSMGIVVDGVNDVLAVPPKDIRPAPRELDDVVERGFVHGLASVHDRLLILVDLERLLATPAQAKDAA
jgi:purine-binding chemotaxis protein CheW